MVEVHRHDWLPDYSLYFVDMELCDLTLEDHIRKMAVEGKLVEQIRDVTDWRFLLDEVAQTVDQPTRSRVLGTNNEECGGAPTPPESSPDPSPADDEFNWESVIEILDDVTSGLIYIHRKNIVHRDLKPRNGIDSNSKFC